MEGSNMAKRSWLLKLSDEYREDFSHTQFISVRDRLFKMKVFQINIGIKNANYISYYVYINSILHYSS